MKIIAHRGASGITGEDNTLKSFRTSWMMACDMVEFDIRQTKCGTIVCYHDREVNGILVSDLTHDELKLVSCCEVPTFEATIIECQGRISLDVEIKEPGFEATALELLHKYLDKACYTIKSFNPEIVKKIAELNPAITRGLLLDGCHKGEVQNFITKTEAALKICNPHFLSPHYEVFEPWFLEHESFQLPLFPWTVNAPDDMRKLLEFNPAGIITDRPDFLVEVIKRPRKNIRQSTVEQTALNNDSKNLITLLEDCEIDARAINTRHVRIGAGMLDEASSWVNSIVGESAKIAIIADDNTVNYADAIAASFTKQPQIIVLHPRQGWAKLTPHADFCKAIIDQAPDADILIACGSGTINDLTKYAAFLNNIPYVSCATAASMNGYTSSIAALLVDNLKTTIACSSPVVLLADIDVMAKAPKKMAISGYSDLLSKPMSTGDWELSHILFDVPYDELPSTVVNAALKKSIEAADEIANHTPSALECLMESLVLSGFSMTLAGSSAPASGGEHLISHYLDMKNYASDMLPALHGQQVAIGTLITTLLYQELFKLNPENLTFVSKSANDLKTVHQELWEQVKPEALKQLFSEKQSQERLAIIKEKWPLMLKMLKDELWSYEELQKCLLKGNAETNPEQLGIKREWLELAFMHACDIRNRYSILHLASEIGLLDKVKNKIMRIIYN